MQTEAITFVTSNYETKITHCKSHRPTKANILERFKAILSQVLAFIY